MKAYSRYSVISKRYPFPEDARLWYDDEGRYMCGDTHIRHATTGRKVIRLQQVVSPACHRYRGLMIDIMSGTVSWSQEIGIMYSCEEVTRIWSRDARFAVLYRQHAMKGTEYYDVVELIPAEPLKQLLEVHKKVQSDYFEASLRYPIQYGDPKTTWYWRDRLLQLVSSS